MRKVFLLLGAVFCLALISEGQRMLCHYRNWTTHRLPSDTCSCMPKHLDINADYCTHLIYHYVGVNETGVLYVADIYSDLCILYGLCGYEKIAFLKQQEQYKDLKTLFWIGTDGMDGTISNVASDETKRATFVTSCLSFVQYYDYDGMILDWRKPYEADTWAFTLVVQDLQNAFSAQGLEFGVTAYRDEDYAVYEDNALEIADFVITHAFWHRGFDAGTWHPSPLYMCPDDLYSLASKQNVDAMMDLYKDDVSSSKLIVPIYGEGLAFTLSDSATGGFAEPIAESGNLYECTQINYFINYYETLSNSFQAHPQDTCKIDIYVSGNQWAGAESPTSVEAKAQYAKDNGYGGLIFMQMDGDDFNGRYGDSLPLHKIAYETLFAESKSHK